MGSGRTRKRNASDSRLSSANASPLQSASVSPDVEERVITTSPSKSRGTTLSPELEISTIEEFQLWEESELKELIKQVYRKKAIDSNNLDAIEGKDLDAVKGLCDKLRKAIDQSMPEVGVKEMIASMANELAHVKTTRNEGGEILNAYKKMKGEYDVIVKAMKVQNLNARRAINQLPKEMETRKVNETAKGKAEAKLKAVTKMLQETKNSWNNAHMERHVVRLNELETRRRLDKIRLKIAATRGEMMCPTVDVLERAPPRWMVERNVCESVTSSEGKKKIGMVDEEKEEDRDSSPSSKDANNSQDADDREGEGKNRKLKKKKKSKDEDGDVEMDSVEVGEVKEDEGGGDGGGSERKKEEEEKDDTNNNADDIGFNEDQVAMEIRLLKNRLDMYNTEVRDWINTHRSIEVQIGYVDKAKFMLQHELSRTTGGVDGGNERRAGVAASKAGKARRVAAVQASPESTAASPLKRSQPASAQQSVSKKRRRKGVPKKNPAAAVEIAKEEVQVDPIAPAVAGTAADKR